MPEAENPPAFPLMEQGPHCNEGMSLRDWFAGQALAGFIAEGAQREIDAACRAEPDFLDKGPEARARIVNDQVAWGCYSLADAMLSARQHTRAEPDLVEVLEKQLKAERHRATNAEYWVEALVNMLGPTALKVWHMWQDKRLVRVHYSWGPEAAPLTGEERAGKILEWEAAAENATPIENVDGHIATLTRADV